MSLNTLEMWQYWLSKLTMNGEVMIEIIDALLPEDYFVFLSCSGGRYPLQDCFRFMNHA
ncbi:hypothetical protein PSSHI_12780 [Photobacterium sp. R1]